MSQENESASPQFDKSGLYREDSFTDRQVGSIRQLTPVTPSGERDEDRPVLFMGATQVMTGAGPVPLNFDIPGETLGDAADGPWMTFDYKMRPGTAPTTQPNLALAPV